MAKEQQNPTKERTSKDLIFTPNLQRNLPEMEKDIKDFTRKL